MGERKATSFCGRGIIDRQGYEFHSLANWLWEAKTTLVTERCHIRCSPATSGQLQTSPAFPQQSSAGGNRGVCSQHKQNFNFSILFSIDRSCTGAGKALLDFLGNVLDSWNVLSPVEDLTSLIMHRWQGRILGNKFIFMGGNELWSICGVPRPKTFGTKKFLARSDPVNCAGEDLFPSFRNKCQAGCGNTGALCVSECAVFSVVKILKIKKIKNIKQWYEAMSKNWIEVLF